MTLLSAALFQKSLLYPYYFKYGI